ncbi:MAG: shikimate kinase [Tepidisphaerales bacterium]
MNVILIGYRGCGKTTIGRKLADRLWQTFVDVDDLIVQRAGKSIKRIFEEDGEPHFRETESAVLREVLAADETVIALGGGTVIREENRRLIKSSGAKVIYLRCDPGVLDKRIQSDAKTGEARPALTELGGGIDEIKLKLAEREPLYREVMTGEFEVTHQTVDDTVHRIARML